MKEQRAEELSTLATRTAWVTESTNADPHGVFKVPRLRALAKQILAGVAFRLLPWPKNILRGKVR